MRSLVFLFAVVAVRSVAGDDKLVNLCGRALANARVLLCFGPDAPYKRSPNEIPDSSGKSLQLGDWVWGGRRDALAAPWLRHKRGLVDDCCLKPCTPDVIRTYC